MGQAQSKDQAQSKHRLSHGTFKEPLIMQLTIPLARGNGPLFRQVYVGLRQAILAGSFHGDGRLPSTRDLADHLGISRAVVLQAYDQLLAEGFVTGRSGSGTYVAQGVPSSRSLPSKKSVPLRLSRFGSAAARTAATLDFQGRRPRVHRYDFAFGRSESDIETFPFETWRRILLRRARKASVSHLDYGPAAGSAALREAICAHLRRSRAVVCDASDVIVVNGSQQALDLIARVLLERGDPVAIENPAYHGTKRILLAAGAELLPVAVDRDGLDPARLPAKARMCFVTPSHQFPTGAILPLARRVALLAWARRKNAAIVEDDYDGEFRYEGQPLESLQGLDTDGRILYVGTFSRTVFPALRVGYLIVPKSLAAVFTAAKWLNDPALPHTRAGDACGIHRQRCVRAPSAPRSPPQCSTSRGAARGHSPASGKSRRDHRRRCRRARRAVAEAPHLRRGHRRPGSSARGRRLWHIVLFSEEAHRHRNHAGLRTHAGSGDS
jgi:GntR family transcriptional regulator / MocR family aminotransferase